jgi:hypothetical protein
MQRRLRMPIVDVRLVHRWRDHAPMRMHGRPYATAHPWPKKCDVRPDRWRGESRSEASSLYFQAFDIMYSKSLE